MSSTRRPKARGLLVVGSVASLRRAEELIAAHAKLRPVRTETTRGGGTGWRRTLDGAAGVILIADPETPVGEAVEGTHVSDRDRFVPIGVLPDDPRAFAAAALAQRRAPSEARLTRGPFVLLSSREDHVRERANRMSAILTHGEAPFRDLPTGRIDRATLLTALASGPGLVIYTGEGNAHGWGGYGRLQSWELHQPGTEPLGALISLSCSGSARLGSLHGLCESVVAHGSAASALGAVSEVPSKDNENLGTVLVERLNAGAANLAEALPEPTSELQLFRISGDPLAPLIGADGARTALRRISAPGAGHRLQPVSWGGTHRDGPTDAPPCSARQGADSPARSASVSRVRKV